ncbi:hypothetical protein [Proteiniphilum sp.]|uniref:hypothetical protein n=1 Tax=Proteiniphilum sp. TaxID=1926877 RepID=UPI002B1F184B|nr:hypothetical protein [Proteiniphilum sp.]MEA4918499.1 hypothetical protein [Proteiniphilum sp.]
MKKLTIYFIIMHTAMLLIMGFGVWFILNKFFPSIMIEHYYIIPLFFYLIGIIYILRLRRTPIDQPKKMVNLYMLMRMIKIFLSFMIILLYWLIDKPNIRNFAIIFVVFYLINLIWETYIYMRMELYLKHKSDELHSPQKTIDQ